MWDALSETTEFRYCGERKIFSALLSCKSVKLLPLQLIEIRPDNELLYGLQVQGEMDAAGGQFKLIGGAAVVVVVEGKQLVKPSGFRLVKEVPFEQLPP